MSVTSTDTGSNTYAETLTVSITNVNEAASFTTSSTASAAENACNADEYCEGLSVKEGRKYFRIAGTNRNGCETVKGFVVKSGDKKFQEGDMLKPAGFNAPARNFARGNVFDEASTGTVDWPHIRWTGIG